MQSSARRLVSFAAIRGGRRLLSSLHLPAIAYAKEVLRQHKTALDMLASEPALYGKQSAQLEASIGQHVRHNLDHFSKLLQAVQVAPDKHVSAPDTSVIIDYDTRERGTPEETQIVTARRMVSTLEEKVEQLTPVLLKPVNVRFVANASGDSFIIRSSVERELAFVAHHAIHHLVSIKLIAREFGVRLPDEIGVAPSTLAARQAEASKHATQT